MAAERTEDRRVQKTQRLLREALASLIREKPYESIAVKEILDRANVGRSTFYMHFRDKDALLVSGIQEMFRTVEPVSPKAKGYEKFLRFSLPVFEFHERHRHAGEARMGARARAVLHGHLQRVLADWIAEDVRKDLSGKQRKSGRIAPELLVQHVAATFVLVLNWWVETRNPLSPKGVNDVFRALILPALDAAWG